MVREPVEIYRDEQLSPGAKLLLVVLWRYVGDRQPSGAWLATAPKSELRRVLGVARATLNRYTRELLDSPWLVSATPHQYNVANPVWSFELKSA